ncbi:hyoscyamine 6-dioxygenase-like [Andrographis paniculata]|uniref:hyoscyamine 6-dioxygenase-like n=1 Tax=Andrographis paniculata TaxID=175694 RepID=UPI0021E74E0F|nr:hyoscyamine 6-dioxygenase-like [Andrographis paniculata]
MVVLMSDWATGTSSVPETYILPPGQRPGKLVFPVLSNVPLIDLENVAGEDQIIPHILEASQEFGCFYVTNHGVPLQLMGDAMAAVKEFLATPAENKAKFYSNSLDSKCRIYSSSINYDSEEVHYWRDNFTHHCHPLDEQIHLWPDNPSTYRAVIGEYSTQVRKLLFKILELFRRGMGLKRAGYFEGPLSGIQLMSVNHHIPCPDPTLTLGMPQHSDPNLITVLHQGHVPGLQVFRGGEWVDIEPLPHAFLVIPGLQLKVISNGKLNTPKHRVITNAKGGRTTIGTFLNPSQEAVIEAAAAADEDSKAYTSFTYKEFFKTFIGSGCDARLALQCFSSNTSSSTKM